MAFIAYVPRSYTSAFGFTENTLTDGGRWINGGTVGLDWQDCRCTPGLAFGVGSSPSPPFNDPTAVLMGAWGRTQTVEATVVVPASPTGFQEVELRLLTTIEAHRIVGYEVLFSVTGNTYVEIRRWDGGFSSVSDFPIVVGGSGPQLQTGYRVKATVTAAGLFTAYVDSGGGYTSIISGTDTTYRSGALGLGFYNNGAGSPSDFGVSSFSALAS